MQIRIGIPYVFTMVMEQQEFVERCKQSWEKTKKVTSNAMDCVQPAATQTLLYAAYASCVAAQVVTNASITVQRKLQNSVVDLACKRATQLAYELRAEDKMMQQVMKDQSVN